MLLITQRVLNKTAPSVEGDLEGPGELISLVAQKDGGTAETPALDHESSPRREVDASGFWTLSPL